MGKATGKDKDAGKATLVDRLGLDGARGECDRLVAVCEDAVSPGATGRRRCARPPASRWRAKPDTGTRHDTTNPCCELIS